MISKNYTIAQEMDWTYGKWPDFLGNTYFIDSKWLYLDIVDMLKDKIEAFVPEQFNAQKDDSPYNQLIELFRAGINPEKMNEHAFYVLGKMRNREEEYIYGDDLNLLRVVNNFQFHFRNTGCLILHPFFDTVEKLEWFNF